MRYIAIAAFALFTALPALDGAQAQETLDADAFEAYTEGRTLSFALDGVPYGIEEYLPNRRVRWAFVGQECQSGVWYERAGNICFLYDNAPADEQCWRFSRTDDGLRGVFQGADGPSTELYEVQQTNMPLNCAGPSVGA